jgi:hypothetical protein
MYHAFKDACLFRAERHEHVDVKQLTTASEFLEAMEDISVTQRQT